MSRSYRKPYWKIEGSPELKTFQKRQANKAVRRADVASGSSFKKVFDSWNICDLKLRSTDPKARRK